MPNDERAAAMQTLATMLTKAIGDQAQAMQALSHRVEALTYLTSGLMGLIETDKLEVIQEAARTTPITPQVRAVIEELMAVPRPLH